MNNRRKNLNIYIGLIIVCLFGGCQKDDICPESVDTTPMLLINFYDNTDEVPKRSLNLTIREEGSPIIDTLLYRENAFQIAIPLRTTENSTSYEFVLNADIIDENGELQPPENSQATPNTDVITFNYQREEEYLNRACSYKIKYLGLNLLRKNMDDGAWIKRISVVTNDIITDNLEDDPENDLDGAHINIFF